MNSDMNSSSWKISWNHIRIHIYMNSSKNSGCWIHIWIHIMNSSMNSVLLGTTLVLTRRVVIKTKAPPPTRLLSIQPKSQTSTLTLSFHRRLPRRQSCAPSTNCWRLWGWGTSSRRGRRRCFGRLLSAQGRRSGSFRWSFGRTRRLASAFRPWAGEVWAPAQSKPTQGDCTSLQRHSRRVVRQIYEVQGTSGSRNHFPAVEAHSTVQHSWLQHCPRQDHLRLDVQKSGLQSKLRKRGRNS